jgi:hypothetical protein
MIPLVGMIISGICFVGFASWYFWPSRGAAAVTEAESKTQKPYDEFAGLSNSQLRAKIEAFAADLRRMEVMHDDAYSRLSLQEFTEIQGKSRDEANAIRARVRSQQDDIRSAKNLDFRNNFMPQAQALERSLLARIGPEPQNQADDRAAGRAYFARSTLESGMLAGVYPLNGLANYLQMRAGRLP